MSILLKYLYVLMIINSDADLLYKFIYRLEAIDRAALRPDRFSNVLFVPAPGPNERGLVLKALARKMSVDASVDLQAVGKMEECKYFNGADLLDAVCVFLD